MITNPVYVMNMVNLFLNVAIQSSIIFIPLRKENRPARFF